MHLTVHASSVRHCYLYAPSTNFISLIANPFYVTRRIMEDGIIFEVDLTSLSTKIIFSYLENRGRRGRNKEIHRIEGKFFKKTRN